MRLELVNVIKEFCEMFKFEYLDGEFELVTTDDIAEYVKRDDEEYYEREKDGITEAYGLFYENSRGRKTLVISKKQDSLNLAVTTIHEYVHLCDYKQYGELHPEKSLRELQEDYVFKYWTEFHAPYMAYKYYIATSHNFNLEFSANTIVRSVQSKLVYQKRLEIHYAMYQSVHAYGEYIALCESYPDRMNAHPKNFYINDKFREIYKFLFTHITIDKFLEDYQEFEKLINSI